MYSLLKKHNRKYYRRIVAIHVYKWYRLAKMWVAANLMKLANKVDGDFMKEYDKTVIRKHYERLDQECG